MCLLVAIMVAEVLKAPFPWFGGKSRAAALIWAGFGNVPNYVEPFAGSLAVLLGRPHAARIETVNDLDCYVSNFWRAVKWAPELVAEHADWPVNEADLHARHRDLVARIDFRKRMKREARFFDAEIAGWWVWGLCQWIGSGWCASSNWSEGPTRTHRIALSQQMPMLSGDSGASGRGVHASGATAGPLVDWMRALAVRLRRVRVCCGPWSRILGRSVTEAIGDTAVLLDPPYLAAAGRDPSLYSSEDLTVANDVREWAIANGKNPKLRIALCGYEGEHEMPSTWECIEWKAAGGYAASAGNHENAHRERIWFSPACGRVRAQGELFETSTGRAAS